MPRRSVWERLPPVIKYFLLALKGFFADNIPRAGASLAYYTLFAIAPILVIAIAVAGAVFGEEAVRGQIVGQIDQLVGRQGAEAVQSLLAGASQQNGGTLAAVLGAITLVITSTGAFMELQTALNAIWRVKPKPGFNLKEFIWNRLISFAMVVGLGFLLMVSLIVSAGLAALGHWFNGLSGVHLFWDAVNLIVSTGVITLLFACIYRFLPDVRLQWRDVWMGALVTAVLFTVGKELIGLYIGQSGTASTYGAAGSVVILLLWVYYSSQIVLLGAEFTRVYTERTRKSPAPEPYAKKESAMAKKTPGGVGVKAA